MKVTELINQNVTGTLTGTVFEFEMPKSSRGIVAFEVSNIASGEEVQVRLVGRLSDRFDFFVVADINPSGSDTITLTSTNNSYTAQDIQIYPQMKVNIISAPSSGADIKATVSN